MSMLVIQVLVSLMRPRESKGLKVHAFSRESPEVSWAVMVEEVSRAARVSAHFRVEIP